MSSSSYADFYELAEKEGNLNAGGGATELLPEDLYTGRVFNVKHTPKADGKKIGLQVEITEGPLAGKKLWANLQFSKGKPKGVTAFFITAEKFGMTKEFFFRTPAPTDAEITNNINGKTITVKVTHGEWNNQPQQYGNVDSVVGGGLIPGVVAPVAPVAPVGIVPASVPTPVSVQPAFNPLGGPVQQAS